MLFKDELMSAITLVSLAAPLQFQSMGRPFRHLTLP
jgi:hypothetical protein